MCMYEKKSKSILKVLNIIIGCRIERLYILYSYTYTVYYIMSMRVQNIV